MRLHHIGYVVRSIDEEVTRFKQLFGAEEESPTYFDPLQDVRVKFLWKHYGDLDAIEFVEPVSERSPVYSYLMRFGGGINHLCYEVSGLDTEIKRLIENGAILVRNRRPAVAFKDREVAFLLTGQRLLIELLEVR